MPHHAEMPWLETLLNSGTLAGVCGPGSLGGVMIGAFAMALVGGFGHCATMCGPFVLMQVTQTGADGSGGDGPLLRRLPAALLPGYQAGRFTTYMALGAAAGGLGGGAVALTGFKELTAVLLGLAALVMAACAAKGWLPTLGAAPGLPRGATRLLARMAGGGGTGGGMGARGYRLGLVLGLLPCGFLYAALAAAAATGGALSGALVMGAFVAGTLPALTLVALAGFGLAGRWRAWAVRLAPPVYLVNAVTLGTLAVRILR